uniref:Tigger transposable element-derived protein 6 n=1 Tax=Zeugodacus cucurbitae TaxID=28588 RepID=A0A0A1WDP0_ZEUCU
MILRKYKCLTIAEKKKLIEKVEEGEKKSDVAKEFLAIEPLVDISGVSFSDFVQVGENVAVSGSLTDGEILSATDTQSNNEDEDDTSEPLAQVSVKEARSSFDTLQSFCLQNESEVMPEMHFFS